MTHSITNPDERPSHPRLEFCEHEPATVRLHGEWTLRRLGPDILAIRFRLAAASRRARRWDLNGVTQLDSFGAGLLWQAWQLKWPEHSQVSAGARAVIDRCARAFSTDLPMSSPRSSGRAWLVGLGELFLSGLDHLSGLIRLLGQLCLDVGFLIGRPREWPWREWSANLYKVGVMAMPVAALVGFLIGVVLSYLSALQLKTYGADIFIVDILGLGIIRELGPVLVSVLVAGRSGSAMTAQIGVMRVTEEIDALAAIGVSRTQRLVLPKVLALGVAMPLLVVWTSAAALLGGMLAAWVQMDLSMGYFIQALPAAVPIANVLIGLSKGLVFGLLIALVACHFGLRVAPNTESLSANTTASVVTAITLVILVDAIFAIATRSIGLPL